MSAVAILDQEFLALRARLLDVAATLDRVDRADECGDRRVEQIRVALETLLAGCNGERAEQIQLLFSRPYDEDWREEFRLLIDE